MSTTYNKLKIDLMNKVKQFKKKNKLKKRLKNQINIKIIYSKSNMKIRNLMCTF